MTDAIQVVVSNGPALWRERRLRELHDDLRAAGVAETDLRPAAAPSSPGTKGAVESAVLLLGASVPIARPMIETAGAVVRAWIERDRRTTLRVTLGEDELEITGDPTEEQLAALDKLLRRHNGDDEPAS